MAVDAQTLLSQTEDAISRLLVGLADGQAQEVQLPDGRRIRRAEFATTIDALRRARSELLVQTARSRRSPFRLARFSRSS